MSWIEYRGSLYNLNLVGLIYKKDFRYIVMNATTDQLVMEFRTENERDDYWNFLIKKLGV